MQTKQQDIKQSKQASKEQKNNKEKISKDKILDEIKTKSLETVLKHSDYMFKILVSTLKHVETTEYEAVEILNTKYPEDKNLSPYRRLEKFLSRYIKHLNNLYQNYLKENNLKSPKKRKKWFC